MTQALDDMLLPGEWVLYRDPRWRRGDVVAHALVIGLVLGFMVFVADLADRKDHPVWLSALVGGAMALTFMLPAIAGVLRRTALITSQRLLYIKRWSGRVAFEIPLAELTHIGFQPNGIVSYVTVTAASGDALKLESLAKPQAFAAALAKAANLPCPPLVGRMKLAETYALTLGCCLPAVVVSGLYLAEARSLLEGSDYAREFPFLAMLAVTAGIIWLIILSLHMVTLVSMATLRRWASAEEMLAVLFLSDKRGKRRRPWRWVDPVYEAWATFLYGQSMTAERWEELRRRT